MVFLSKAGLFIEPIGGSWATSPVKIILQFVVFIVVSTFIAVIVITEMESTEMSIRVSLELKKV